MTVEDFKMLEKPPYDHPNPKKSLELALRAISEEEKTYGPVFREKYIEYALQFVSQRLGETPEKDIKTIDQLMEYLISIADKHPNVVNVILYAGLKAESYIMGRSGALTRVGLIGYFKNIEERPAEKRNMDIDQLLATYQQTTIQLEVAFCEIGYKKNADESIDIIWPNCHLKEGCRLAQEEGVATRVTGGLQCLASVGVCQMLKLLSGYEWDYELMEFDKPHCIARIYLT